MKRIWKEIAAAVLLAFVLPNMMLNAAFRLAGDRSLGVETQPETTSPQQTKGGSQSFQIPVYLPDGSVASMELDEYLTGVVLGEMPEDFEPEAQKAQAVVARTYALRTYQEGVKHPAKAVCTDPSCCQGYRSPETYLADGGTREGLDKIRRAVSQTSGQVLTYDGELIEATYFSCSGGMTEDALAVWGADIPYLQAVPSPGEEQAAHYTDTVTFTREEFAGALGVDLEGMPAAWLGAVTYTDGGGVDTMVIGGVTYRGTTLRQLLGLRSTAFVMTAAGDHITVTTRGYGHRVGMSQYGADAMAAAGSGYEEILAYYYQGTSLVQWIDKNDELG